MKSILVLLVSTLVFYSCQKHSEHYWVEAVVDSSITEFSDTVFFKWISDIEVIENDLYFLDKGSGRVYLTNDNFEIKRSIGTLGPGPMELQAANNLELEDGVLYVYDYTGRKVISYDSMGRVLASSRAPSFLSEFFVESSYMYVCTNEVIKSPLEKLDLISGDTQERFGVQALSELNLPPQHLVKVGDYIVAIYAYNHPYIDVYDKEGTFIRRNDLASDEIFGAWLETSNIKKLIESSSVGHQLAKTMFWDVYSFDSHLYIMPPAFEVDGKGKLSFIVEISFDTNGVFNLDRFIELKIDDYLSPNCFAVVDSDRILAYAPGAGSIIKFHVQN